jgi:membrane fusion protein, heavy metal efflux system
MTIFHKKSSLWFTLFALMAGLAGCSSDATSTTSEAAEKKPPVNLLATATVEPVEMALVKNELTLTGKITVNQDKVVKVFPLVGGHIEAIKTDLGAYVTKGQVMAVIRSGDMADLEQQAVTAQSQLAVAQKNLQVADDLTKGGLTSQRELVAAREQLVATKGELNRVNERRKILGGGGSVYTMKAPVSGFVVEKTAAPGMEIRPDDPENLFTISNLDQVWVMASVYEADISNVHQGDMTKITTLSYPDKIYTGRIDKIFNVLDPESKTMKVRVTLTNPDYKLKPEMFANVSVTYPGRDQRIAIPANALVFDKSRNFVILVNAKNEPMVREVSIFKTIGQTTYLSGGLAAGDKIVTKNQLLVYNALSN